MTETKKSTETPLMKALEKYGFLDCQGVREWAENYRTESEGWEACANPEWMLYALNAIKYEDESKLRLFACWCVRNTPIGNGMTTWDLLTDERSRNAVVVAERFAVGKATI